MLGQENFDFCYIMSMTESEFIGWKGNSCWINVLRVQLRLVIGVRISYVVGGVRGQLQILWCVSIVMKDVNNMNVDADQYIRSWRLFSRTVMECPSRTNPCHKAQVVFTWFLFHLRSNRLIPRISMIRGTSCDDASNVTIYSRLIYVNWRTCNWRNNYANYGLYHAYFVQMHTKSLYNPCIHVSKILCDLKLD